MTVNCYETEYKNFGKCICLENGVIKLMATIDFGPRIIYFGLCGEENILFEDNDRNFVLENGDYGTWYNYGGHRLWCAPEIVPETYYPDNEKVMYSYSNQVLTLTAPETAFKKKFSITCKMSDSGNSVEVINTIKTCSDKAEHFAPWSITALAPGGIEVIPLSKEDCGFLPNRAFSLWSYSDIYDSRFNLFNHSAVLRQDSNCYTAFKAGFSVDDGYVAYILRNQLLTINFDKYKKVMYPDFSSNYETYTNNSFLECETIGEERDYQPSEEATLSELWEITKVNYTLPPINEQMIEFVSKHIKNNT